MQTINNVPPPHPRIMEVLEHASEHSIGCLYVCDLPLVHIGCLYGGPLEKQNASMMYWYADTRNITVVSEHL